VFHVDGLAFMKLATQNFNRQWVLQFALDGSFEGTGTVISIVPNFGQVGACFRADDQPIAPLRKQCRNMQELDIHDLDQVGAVEARCGENIALILFKFGVQKIWICCSR
jgi:hypothetical protein